MVPSLNPSTYNSFYPNYISGASNGYTGSQLAEIGQTSGITTGGAGTYVKAPAPAPAPAPVGGSLAAPGAADSRNLITQAYDTQKSGLRRILRGLDPQRENAEAKVNNTYGTSLESINSARDRGMANLEVQRGAVNASRKNSLRELSDSIRGGIQAFGNRLGTMGAGDSSANELGAYAFSKLNAQGTTDINNQAMDSLGQIGVRTGDLESEVLRQTAELETFKTNALLDISDKYQAMRNQIINDIYSTESEKMLALADLNTSAVQSLSSLDNYLGNFSLDQASAPTFTNPAANNAANFNAQQVFAPIVDAGRAVMSGLSGRSGGGGVAPLGVSTRRDDSLQATPYMLQGNRERLQ